MADEKILLFPTSTETVSIIRSGVQGADLSSSIVTAVMPEPLVCIPGEDRPPFVPEFTGSGSCGIDQAKEALNWILEGYDRSCTLNESELSSTITNNEDPTGVEMTALRAVIAKKTLGSNVVSWSPSADFSYEQPQTCDARPISRGYGMIDRRAIDAIPFIMRNFGLIDPPHEFFNIAFRLNADQLGDFRSGQVFFDLADKLEPVLQAKGERSIKIAYPAAGSHMSPLATVLRLMDNNVIDRASLIYTEIDQNAPLRVSAYLKGEDNLLKNLSVKVRFYRDGELFSTRDNVEDIRKSVESYYADHLEDNKEYEVEFDFEYQGKPIVLTFAIARSGEAYIRDDALAADEPHLLVLHDVGVGEPELVDGIIAQDLRQKHKAPAWIITDGQGDETPDFFSKGLRRFPADTLLGKYGCGGAVGVSAHYNDLVWSKGADGQLHNGDRAPETGIAKYLFPDPFSTKIFPWSGMPPEPIDIHSDNANSGAMLVRIR